MIPKIIKKVSKVRWDGKAPAPLMIRTTITMKIDEDTNFEVENYTTLGANVVLDLINNIPGEMTITRDKDNNVVWNEGI